MSRIVAYVLVELAVGGLVLAGAGAGAYLGGRALAARVRGAEGALFRASLDGKAVGEAGRRRAADGRGQSLEAPADGARRSASDGLGTGTTGSAADLGGPRTSAALGTGAKTKVALAARPAPAPWNGKFQGVDDEELLAPLREARVARVRFNRGGSSLSLRLDFENGARAAFKPDQTNLQSVPRKEVAAYRIDRMLGLGGVPPALARAFPREELVEKLDPSARREVGRLMTEAVVDGEEWIAGELSWWIPKIKDATIGGYRLDSVDGMVLWKRYLRAGAPVPPEEAHLLPQISKMVVFDFLTHNVDRWSGSNVKASADGRLLYFMDNTLSFGPEPTGNVKTRSYLSRVQKFSRHMVEALRALDERKLRDTMTTDTGPYETLLTDREIAAVLARRNYLLAYIDDLVRQHGEENVLVFP